MLPFADRDAITVKGYQGKWGKSWSALIAIRMSLPLPAIKVVNVYSSGYLTWFFVKFLFLRSDLTCNVYLKGALSHEGVIALLGSSRLYIGNSRSDGLPSSLLEAMLTGAFPIQSSSACLDGWIEHGKSGYRLDVGTVKEIRRALIWFKNNTEIEHSAVAINRQRVVEEYSRDSNNSLLEILGGGAQSK